MFKNDHEKEMSEVRNQANKNFKQAAELYNTGQISKKEFYFYKDEIIKAGNEARKEIIDRRECDIDREQERLLNRIVGSENKLDIERYRKLYTDYKDKAKDKAELIKEYEISIKLNDSVAGKAAAAIAVEHGINEIANDYGARDKDFTEAVKNYRGFTKKWRDDFRKFSEYQSGHFGFIREPKSKVETYEQGYNVNEFGQRLPHFRERIVYDK